MPSALEVHQGEDLKVRSPWGGRLSGPIGASFKRNGRENCIASWKLKGEPKAISRNGTRRGPGEEGFQGRGKEPNISKNTNTQTEKEQGYLTRAFFLVRGGKFRGWEGEESATTTRGNREIPLMKRISSHHQKHQKSKEQTPFTLGKNGFSGGGGGTF